ncbi:MAG TPA: efflux RND transporter periplasmic adaptor subunit [Burkholderiales bacterium]|nr:efflux RND transporter periplasmic adaptor subunit [Burkholderiales bacterium]
MSAIRTLGVVAIAGAVVLAGAAGFGVANWRAEHSMRNSDRPPSDRGSAPSAAKEGERQVLYWYDPMYPQHKFDQPGKSPFMDMQLIPKYADEVSASGVKIDPTLAQNLGMRLATVERQTMSTGVSAVATVGFNERDVAIVQARTGGFVERVYARAPGDVVRAGAALADVLVSEWAGAQAEFLAVKATGDAELTAAARERLRLLGMTEAQIAQVERSGQLSAVMTITFPIAGVIQELGIRAGMSVTPGMTLARINGLRTVWLEAAVPEVHAAMLVAGRRVEALFSAYPGEVFEGKIAAVLPEADRDTRTLRVRMEFANRGQRLKAGMFAQVTIAGESKEALMVPADAIIRTGKRALAFVSEQPGQFTPVEVEVGQEMDGKLTVLSGLEEGQQVAVSGQFLIDSEASLSGLTQRMGEGSTAAGDTNTQAAAGPIHEGIGTVEELSGTAVTLKHGPIASLQWGPMTMPFSLPSPDVAKDLKAGDSVRFRFRQVEGNFVIESIEKTGGGR